MVPTGWFFFPSWWLLLFAFSLVLAANTAFLCHMTLLCCILSVMQHLHKSQMIYCYHHSKDSTGGITWFVLAYEGLWESFWRINSVNKYSFKRNKMPDILMLIQPFFLIDMVLRLVVWFSQHCPWKQQGSRPCMVHFACTDPRAVLFHSQHPSSTSSCSYVSPELLYRAVQSSSWRRWADSISEKKSWSALTAKMCVSQLLSANLFCGGNRNWFERIPAIVMLSKQNCLLSICHSFWKSLKPARIILIQHKRLLPKCRPFNLVSVTHQQVSFNFNA